MTMTYTRLPARNLQRDAGLLRPACILPERVGLDNPALDVMTDFRRLTAFIATPGDTIKQAEERMIRRKVRLLFVMDSLDRVAGLITSTDLSGERPMSLVHARNLRFDELRVSDVMTDLSMLDAIDYDTMVGAAVSNVVAAFQRVGRNHLLVVQAASHRRCGCAP